MGRTDPARRLSWLARQLQEMVTHHLDEEEQEVFQLAGRVFDDAAKQSLAKTYQEEMQRLAS
ncbi:hypothetical protein [Chromohalobacter nigrandesensis]|uniref:hypothetical protein n=1 Tax=Chromohalobacter nigrandesensis TaxID=119863 RepID=UPI001FF52260|nr:hypothetical protein [Chromohalobacter nigrandesensis]MCK0746087.1 hypothetical protein [Chromohalobacter nigrandesensis]